MKRSTGWGLVLVLNVLAFCMLGFYQRAAGGSPGGTLPFANTTETQLEVVQELKAIKELLKEQSALLRSGEVKVIITELPKPEAAPADAR